MANARGKSFGVEQNERIREAARQLLAQHGGNQRELAEALGVAQPTISNFLTAKSGAGVRLAESIASKVGVSLDALASGRTDQGGPRWRNLPWWNERIAIARRMAPRVSELAWQRMGNLMGEMPPSDDPATLAMMALSWDQASSDKDRAEANSELARAEMAEEDAATDDLLRRRHQARERGEPVPLLPDERAELAPPPPRPSGKPGLKPANQNATPKPEKNSRR